MASIYKRGRVWYLSYYHKGKRVRKRVGTSKKLAELAREDVEVKIAKGEIGWEEVKDPTFGEFKYEYLSYLQANTRPTTYVRYRKALLHFADFLATYGGLSWKLSQISFQFIEQYKQRRIQAVKPLTVNVELKVLKALYNFAIKCNCARENPVTKVAFYKEPDKKPRFLTQKEINHLLSNSNGLYPILYTFLKTGLRKSELVNLRWEDIDFQRKCIKIESKEGWYTKTGNSREIPMDGELAKVLRSLPKVCEYVFVNTNGKRYGYHLTERLKRLARRTGMDGLTLHTLRHTFISHLVMNGVDLVTVKELAGHADIKTTMRYAHLAPEHLRKSIGKLPY